METAIKFFKSTCLFKRHNDEGIIRPFVHWILHAAAASMKSEIYHVVSEPCVFPANEDWLSDLAVMETQCIMQHHVMKVLVETKGTGVFPRNLQNVKIGHKNYKASEDISQLFQQVALAYASGLWQNSLLCGLVTSDEWHFFVVESTSSKQQPFRMSVTGYSTFNVNPPKPDGDDDDDDDVPMSIPVGHLLQPELLSLQRTPLSHTACCWSLKSSSRLR
jgi:hypothetical protein